MGRLNLLHLNDIQRKVREFLSAFLQLNHFPDGFHPFQGNIDIRVVRKSIFMKKRAPLVDTHRVEPVLYHVDDAGAVCCCLLKERLALGPRSLLPAFEIPLCRFNIEILCHGRESGSRSALFQFVDGDHQDPIRERVGPLAGIDDIQVIQVEILYHRVH